jgi:hypothetical protein
VKPKTENGEAVDYPAPVEALKTEGTTTVIEESKPIRNPASDELGV